MNDLYRLFDRIAFAGRTVSLIAEGAKDTLRKIDGTNSTRARGSKNCDED